MKKLLVKGGKKLTGTIHISGSKNAALPILAATILSNKKIILENIPTVRDVETMINLLSTIGSDIKIKIDGKPFGVFNFLQDQIAWTSDPEFDGILIKAMQRGTTMIIKGVSSRGTNTKDTYSLSGFTAAYKAISKVCK